MHRDLKSFCRRIKHKGYFRDEPTPFFSEQPSYQPKLFWILSAGYAKLEVFLRQIDHELFRIADKTFTYSNLIKEEW